MDNKTKIIRAIDNAGRILLPKDIKRFLDLKTNDKVELSVVSQDGKTFVIIEKAGE